MEYHSDNTIIMHYSLSPQAKLILTSELVRQLFSQPETPPAPSAHPRLCTSGSFVSFSYNFKELL